MSSEFYDTHDNPHDGDFFILLSGDPRAGIKYITVEKRMVKKIGVRWNAERN